MNITAVSAWRKHHRQADQSKQLTSQHARLDGIYPNAAHLLWWELKIKNQHSGCL